jgi:hypothetical protein
MLMVGRVDREDRQDARPRDVGDGLADVELAHAGHREDVARLALGELEALQPLEAEHLLDPELLLRAIEVGEQEAVADRAAPALDRPMPR